MRELKLLSIPLSCVTPGLRTIAAIPQRPSSDGVFTPYTQQSAMMSRSHIRLATSCVETFSPFHLKIN